MPQTASANLFDLIAARAKNPGKMALETADATALTYGALFERSGRAANVLVALGVEPGDRVAMQVDKSTDAIVLALACLRAGAALLPLNTAYTLAELEYFLGDAEPALTLCRPELLSSARQLADKLGLPFVESLGVARDGTFAEKIAAEPSEFETVPRGPDDLAAVLYTSGTTGRPNSASLHLSCYAPVRLLLPTCYRHANSLLSDRRRRSATAFSRRPHCVGSAAAPGRRRVSRAFRRRSFRGVPCALTRLRGLGQNRGINGLGSKVFTTERVLGEGGGGDFGGRLGR